MGDISQTFGTLPKFLLAETNVEAVGLMRNQSDLVDDSGYFYPETDIALIRVSSLPYGVTPFRLPEIVDEELASGTFSVVGETFATRLESPVCEESEDGDYYVYPADIEGDAIVSMTLFELVWF